MWLNQNSFESCEFEKLKTSKQALWNVLDNQDFVFVVVVMVVGWGAIADEMELGMAGKTADHWWQRMKYHLDKRPQGKH